MMTEANSAITMIGSRVTTKVTSTSRTVGTKRAATSILASDHSASATNAMRDGLPIQTGITSPSGYVASSAPREVVPVSVPGCGGYGETKEERSEECQVTGADVETCDGAVPEEQAERETAERDQPDRKRPTLAERRDDRREPFPALVERGLGGHWRSLVFAADGWDPPAKRNVGTGPWCWIARED